MLIKQERITNKILHVIPWNSDKNIGKCYNTIMELVDDDSWVCFIDGDAIHTTTYFGSNIENVIHSNQDYGLFTCYTNRVFCKYQIAPNVDMTNNDQKYHRDLGGLLWEENNTDVLDITKNKPFFSGVLILIKKKYWKLVGGFKEGMMIGVDQDIHKKFMKNNIKVGLMKGVYVQHWYRNNDLSSFEHLL